MRTFLVEAYLPQSRAAELEDAVRRMVEVLAASGSPVRYLRSTFVPEDEVCYHAFEATSEEAVREIGRRASVAFDRVVEARESARGALG